MRLAVSAGGREVEGVGLFLPGEVGWAGDVWAVPAVLWDFCEGGVWVEVFEVSGGWRLVFGMC